MIRILIRFFQAVAARRPQRPWWEYPWWEPMNIIRRAKLRDTFALEVIGPLIAWATIFVAIKHLFPTPR